MTVLYLLFKAYQPGLFDQQVQVTGHVTKRGTVVAPYRSTRKKRPEPPPAPDLFAEADRRAMEEDRKKAEEAEREAKEDAEKAAKKAKQPKFQTKPVPEQYGADAQKGIFVVGKKEELRGAFIDAGIRLVYNPKEKAAFVAEKDLKKLDALLHGNPSAAPADGPPPLSATMDLPDLVARGKALVEMVLPGFHNAIQEAKAGAEKALAAYHAILDQAPEGAPETTAAWVAYTAARDKRIEPWSELRDSIKRAVERRYDKKTKQVFMKRIKSHKILWAGGEEIIATARKQLAAAVDMFGPCDRVRGLVRVQNRGSYNKTTKDIDVGKGRSRKSMRAVVFHEYAHGLEYADNRVMAAAQRFRKAKATRTSVVDIPGHKDEFGFPGDFFHPYVGRVYPDGATEVISMGAERFTDPETMAEFHSKAPDHFYLIMAINTALDQEAEIAAKSYLFLKAAA